MGQSWGGEGAQQVLVILKPSSEDIAPVGGKAQFADVRSNREEKFTLATKTSAFTIGGGQFQENSSRVRLRAPSSVWVAQSPRVNLWTSGGQRYRACAEGTDVGNLNFSWSLF